MWSQDPSQFLVSALSPTLPVGMKEVAKGEESISRFWLEFGERVLEHRVEVSYPTFGDGFWGASSTAGELRLQSFSRLIPVLTVPPFNL